jgi:hypothetical protein
VAAARANGLVPPDFPGSDVICFDLSSQETAQFYGLNTKDNARALATFRDDSDHVRDTLRGVRVIPSTACQYNWTIGNVTSPPKRSRCLDQ